MMAEKKNCSGKGSSTANSKIFEIGETSETAECCKTQVLKFSERKQIFLLIIILPKKKSTYHTADQVLLIR